MGTVFHEIKCSVFIRQTAVAVDTLAAFVEEVSWLDKSSLDGMLCGISVSGIFSDVEILPPQGFALLLWLFSRRLFGFSCSWLVVSGSSLLLVPRWFRLGSCFSVPALESSARAFSCAARLACVL